MISRFLQTILCCSLWLLSSPPVLAQKGEITGRVVGEDGAGAPNLTVMLFPLTSSLGPSMVRSSDRQITDEEGNFKFEGLSPRIYSLSVVGARGYVQANLNSLETRSTYRIGDVATIRMTKGGVITGKVTTATG